MSIGTENSSDLASFYQSLSHFKADSHTSDFGFALQEILLQKSAADELAARYNEISAVRQVEYYVRAVNIQFKRFEARRRDEDLRLGRANPSSNRTLEQHDLQNLPPYRVLRAELLELRKVRMINSCLGEWRLQLSNCVRSLENLGAAWSAVWCWYHQECVGTDGTINPAFATGISVPDWNVPLEDPDYKRLISAGDIVSADESPWTGKEAFARVQEEEQNVKRFEKAALRAHRKLVELITEGEETHGDAD